MIKKVAIAVVLLAYPTEAIFGGGKGKNKVVKPDSNFAGGKNQQDNFSYGLDEKDKLKIRI